MMSIVTSQQVAERFVTTLVRYYEAEPGAYPTYHNVPAHALTPANF
jgi:hypothetical protein